VTVAEGAIGGAARSASGTMNALYSRTLALKTSSRPAVAGSSPGFREWALLGYDGRSRAARRTACRSAAYAASSRPRPNVRAALYPRNPRDCRSPRSPFLHRLMLTAPWPCPPSVGPSTIAAIAERGRRRPQATRYQALYRPPDLEPSCATSRTRPPAAVSDRTPANPIVVHEWPSCASSTSHLCQHVNALQSEVTIPRG